MAEKQTLAERAHDALGEAFKEAIKAEFAGCLAQLDAGTDAAGVRAHFRNGCINIAKVQEIAATVIDEVFSVIA